MALRGRLSGRDHNVVGDAWPPDRLSHHPDRDGRVYCYCDVVDLREEPDEDLGRLFSDFAEPVSSLIDSVPTGRSCTGRRSRRSRSTLGRAGGLCWLATRRMRLRRTWPRAPRWRWRTRWCSLSSVWSRNDSRRTVGLRVPAATANGLGAGANASARSNSLPPDRRPKRGPRGIRQKDLPNELPTSAR